MRVIAGNSVSHIKIMIGLAHYWHVAGIKCGTVEWVLLFLLIVRFEKTRDLVYTYLDEQADCDFIFFAQSLQPLKELQNCLLNPHFQASGYTARILLIRHRCGFNDSLSLGDWQSFHQTLIYHRRLHGQCTISIRLLSRFCYLARRLEDI